MKRLFLTITLLAAATACQLIDPENSTRNNRRIEDDNLQKLARMFSELPMDGGHLLEVHDAVEASSGNGYDEEYTMDRLLTDPGAGVGSASGSKGGPDTKRTASGYANPLRNLIREYFEAHPVTKASVEDMMEQLAASDYQLYWPYSEEWDGETYPIITFDPGYGAESNYGYAVSYLEDGTRQIDSVYVDESVAMERPVWVLNTNRDSGFSPVDLFNTVLPSRGSAATSSGSIAAASSHRKLIMKSFRMLRNYDSWFGGASEFFIKCGSVEGFNASTEAELRLFTPSVTDFMIVVKRKYVKKELPFEVILVSDFSQQLDKVAFLVTEDDGGTRTSWKCQAMVKIQSKSYGIDLDIPYNEKDDIVWRGQLSARFFEEEDYVTGRFGDVIITFELE